MNNRSEGLPRPDRTALAAGFADGAHSDAAMTLNAEFARLEESLHRLIALLEEEEETFWSGYLRRGLSQVKAHRLSGATFVLGCFGGQDTFSDLMLGERWQTEEPLRTRNLNERLTHLRTEVFQSANNIASRKLW